MEKMEQGVVKGEANHDPALPGASRTSDSYSRRLLEILPDAIVLYDLTGRVMFVNDAFVQLYGWTRADCYGKRLDFTPPDEAERTRDAISRALTGENVRMVCRRFTKDGRLVDILLITSLVRDENGERLGIYVVHRDLTERKTLAAALEESQKLYRTLLDASPDPISVYGADGKISYINPAFEQTFGWRIKELAGHGVDFVPPHELAKTIDAVERTLRGERVTLDTQRLTKGGKLLDIQLRTAIFKDSEGKVAGDIVIYRDITASKSIERELESYRDHLEEIVRERTQALTESRERFREMAEMLPEVIFEIDAASVLTFVNRRGMEVLELSEGSLGNKLDLAAKAVPEDRERLRQNFRMRLEGKGMRGVEYTFLRSDGRRHPVLALTSPITREGELVGMRGIIVDMSSHRSMEEQLRHAAKMEAVGTLAGGIAHDFNNILQTILGQVQLLQNGGMEKTDAPKRLANIEHAAERAAGLVRQLMAFGRKSESEMKPTDVNEEVEKALALLERTIPRMISINCELMKNPPLVKADPAQIVQIILNLCTNARDAMEEGGRLTIRTSRVTLAGDEIANHPYADPGEYFLLTVADDGMGMGEETLSRVFEPFYTTKEVGKGSGLGLSTVYGIVKAHGGIIECESSPGKGTVFSVFLPVTGEKRKDAPIGDSTASPSMGDETILIADDDPAVLELAKSILEHQGYTVITALSGEEALDKYVRMPKRFSLVILDLGMPGMGGRRCLESILRIDPKAKVLIASGYSQEREAAGVIEAGAAGFVGKPYRLTYLGKRVREVLDEKR